MFTGISIYALLAHKSAQWVVVTSTVVAVAMILVAVVWAWSDEYNGRIKAEEDKDGRNPKVLIAYRWRKRDDNGNPDSPTTPLTVWSEGSESAANVQIQPIVRGKWRASFRVIQALGDTAHQLLPALAYDGMESDVIQRSLKAAIVGGPNDEKVSRTVPVLITYVNLKGEPLVSEYEIKWDAEKGEAIAHLVRCGRQEAKK